MLKAKVVMSPVEFSSVGHFVSKTPPRDDGSLNVNLGMFGEGSMDQTLGHIDVDRVGLRSLALIPC